MKTKIQYTKKKMKYGFIGMNVEAARAHKIPFKHKHPEHTILIYKKEPKDVRVATERHEEMESYLMRTKHFPYKRAHKNALRFENFNIPFPKKDIKRKLKEVHFRIL